MMEDIQEAIGKWGDDVFGKNHHPANCLAHFFDEVVELAVSMGMLETLFEAVRDAVVKWPHRGSIAISEEQAREESADCAILLMQWAYRNQFDLLAEVQKKHEKNTKRKWGKADERGVIKHLEGTQ